MKILVTGAKGMLGRTLMRSLSGHELIGTDLPELDICAAGAVNDFISALRPDAVIHTAAFTDVDRCESEPDAAFAVNAGGTENIARACAAENAWLLAISTDYVFAGDLDRPYLESDPTGPRSVYGESKLAAEQAVRELCPEHSILRIAWLYGPGGPSFVHTMLKLGAERDSIKVVDDQIGNPTSTFAGAEGIGNILTAGLTGTIHLSCEGEASWYGFAKEIFAAASIDCKLTPCRSEEFPRPAPRPRNSRLENRALQSAGLPAMRDWLDDLQRSIGMI